MHPLLKAAEMFIEALAAAVIIGAGTYWVIWFVATN